MNKKVGMNDKRDRESFQRVVIPIFVLVLICICVTLQESRWITGSFIRPDFLIAKGQATLNHTFQLNNTFQFQYNDSTDASNQQHNSSTNAVELHSVFLQKRGNVTKENPESKLSDTNGTFSFEPPAHPHDQKESFSSCLLVMDENFRLYEWLSYHYHVLPLRYVVVAVDPRSHLSPEPVLDLFRKELNMTIITWTDDDYVVWKKKLPINASSYALTDRYVERQRRFLEMCMRHMQEQGRTWVALWDVDEYISINGYDRVTNGNITLPSDLSEPGVILTLLKQIEQKICFSMVRIDVGSKESTHLNQTLIPNLQPQRLDTLRYLYKNRHGGRKVGNGLGKVFLNVQNITFPIDVPSPHRPIKQLCPGAPGNKDSEEGPFYILHYIASWEAYNFRSQDARIGTYRTWEIWHDRSKRSVIWMSKSERWLEGLVQDVGIHRAWKLLRHAGLPNGYNMSTTGYEKFLSEEESAFP
jgi:hypothetical protein